MIILSKVIVLISIHSRICGTEKDISFQLSKHDLIIIDIPVIKGQKLVIQAIETDDRKYASTGEQNIEIKAENQR